MMRGVATAERAAEYGTRKERRFGAGGAPDLSSLPDIERFRALEAPADPLGIPDEIEALEEAIVVLAVHVNAAKYRLLAYLAELDRLGGWRLAGHRDCADWLHFRTGVQRAVAREWVRTARALPRLPLTSEAMARGELPFSKARTITRIVDDLADPEKPGAEAELLGYARECTTAELERLVRSWKLVNAVDEQELERRRHASRHLTVTPDGDGMYRVTGTLDPEVGALLMRAVEAASDALYREEGTGERTHEDWAPEGGTRGPRTRETTPRQRRADAIGLLAERAMAAGFGARAGAEGGGSGEAARDEDATGACDRGRRALSGTRAERYQVTIHVDEDTLREDAEGTRSHLEDGTRVSAETSRRLACDAGVVEVVRGRDGSVLDVGRRTRTIPPALRRALEIRDGGCRFPGCGLRFTAGHHVKHWKDGGETKLSNLVSLCRVHHRAVHEDGFDVRHRPGGGFQFFDRTGWPLPDRAPAMRPAEGKARGEAVGPDPLAALLRDHRGRGIRPDGFTLAPSWKREGSIPRDRLARVWEAIDPP